MTYDARGRMWNIGRNPEINEIVRAPVLWLVLDFNDSYQPSAYEVVAVCTTQEKAEELKAAHLAKCNPATRDPHAKVRIEAYNLDTLQPPYPYPAEGQEVM